MHFSHNMVQSHLRVANTHPEDPRVCDEARTIRAGLTIPARSTHPHSPPQRGVRLRDARVGDGIRAMVRPHDFEQVGATKPRLFR